MSVLLSLSLSLGARCLRECGFSFCQSHGVSLAGEKAAGAMGSWSCLCLGGDRSVYLARPDPHPLAQNVLLIKLMFLISVQCLQWPLIWLSKSHKEWDCHLPGTLKLHHFIPPLFYHLSILDSYEFIRLRLSGKLFPHLPHSYVDSILSIRGITTSFLRLIILSGLFAVTVLFLFVMSLLEASFLPASSFPGTWEEDTKRSIANFPLSRQETQDLHRDPLPTQCSPVLVKGEGKPLSPGPPPLSVSGVYLWFSQESVNKGKWRGRNVLPSPWGHSQGKWKALCFYYLPTPCHQPQHTFIPLTCARSPRRKMQFGSNLIITFLEPWSKNGKNPNNAGKGRGGQAGWKSTVSMVNHCLWLQSS